MSLIIEKKLPLKDVLQSVKKMRSWFLLSNFQKLSETKTANEKVQTIYGREILLGILRKTVKIVYGKTFIS